MPKTKPSRTRKPDEISIPTSLVVPIDHTTVISWFADSRAKDESIRSWRGTEAEMLARALVISGTDLESFARAAIRTSATRAIATLHSPHARHSSVGVPGAADDRLAMAWNELLARGLAPQDITSSRLAYTAKPRANYDTCTRWLRQKFASLGIPIPDSLRDPLTALPEKATPATNKRTPAKKPAANLTQLDGDQ